MGTMDEDWVAVDLELSTRLDMARVAGLLRTTCGGCRIPAIPYNNPQYTQTTITLTLRTFLAAGQMLVSGSSVSSSVC